MSTYGAIGVDLGSLTTLLAAVKSGGVEVLTNDLGNRFTPTIVGLGEKERFLGEAGLSKMSANFRNTVLMAPRLLGISPEYEHLDEEMKWQTCKLVPVDGKLKFEVRYKGEVKQFTAEQVLAMHFTLVKQLCAKAGVGMSDVVISVPSYFTEVERRALLDAAAIADIKCVKLMNDTTASALTYGLFRQRELTEEPRNVAIVDMGHSKLSVAVVAFTKDKLQILSRAYDRHLGGRDFDWMLMEHFATEFKSKRRPDPLQNPKSRLKLANACEKLRKVLSANADAHINVECLVEDYDLTGVMTREGLETLCAPLLDRVQAVCRRALQESGLETLHSVEIVGGGTRMPYVQARLAQAFGLDSVSKTMNAEESVARGCSVQAAMLSAFFKVKDYGIGDRTLYPINISIKNTEEMDDAMTAENLFTANNLFPISKVLTLHKNRPFVMELFYPGDLPAGFNRIIAKYTVNCESSEEEQKIKVTIKMNAHGVVNLESVEKVVTQVVEDMAVEPPAVPSENTQPVPEASDLPDPPPKKEPKKKVTKTPIPSLKHSSSLSDSLLSSLRSLEQTMLDTDRVVHDTADKKNELESMIYTWRDKVNGGCKDYLTSEKAQEILAVLASLEEWVYGEGGDTTKNVYLTKIGQIRDLVDPIDRRYRVFQQIPESASSLRKILSDCLELAHSQHEKYTHIPLTDREPIISLCNSTKTWLDNVIPMVESTPKYQNSPVEPEEIVKKGIQVQELTNSIMNKPKPVPKETKTEEKKTQEEAKMETEEKTEGKMETEEGKSEEPMEVDS